MWRIPVSLLLLIAADLAAAPLETCLSCHVNEDTPAAPPRITGQHADYLRIQLSRFRDEHRSSFPMSAYAQGLSEAESAEFANALSVLPWVSWAGEVDDRLRQWGAQRVEQLQCQACHGEAFTGTGSLPRLAGQNPHYLARQIRGFGRGHRYHPPTGIGSRMVNVAFDEAQAIAHYLSSLDGAQPVP